MNRPVIDWKVVLNWKTYAQLKYIRRSLLSLSNCYINTLFLSPLPRPHRHHCACYPYVGVSQRNCKLAQTSSRMDAQVCLLSATLSECF